MGVCVLPENFKENIKENFKELDFDYDYKKAEKEKSLKQKEVLNKYMQNQQIITVNEFKLEKIRQKKLLKKKTLDKKLHIINSDSILLLSSNKKLLAKTETNNQSESRLFLSATIKSKKYDIINYPKDVLELINKIRKSPKSFIKDIEYAITFIKKYKNRLVYSGNIRVYLNKGETMFKEAINYLKNTNPMNNLILNEDISIELPTEKEFNNDFNYFKNRILKERKMKNIERYYREAIKDPYTGVLMMIVDDTDKNQGEKRKTILDPNLNKVGIKCKFYGNKFLAYLTFGK